MTRKTLSCLVVAAVLAVPAAAAQANDGNGPNEQVGNGQANGDHGTNGHAGKGQAKKCEKPRRVGFVVKGAFVTFVDPDVTVDVRRANRHARRWLKANDPVFSTDDAKVRFIGLTDDDSSGTVDFGDAVETDRVKVRAKLIKPKRGCEGDTTVKVKRINVKRPDSGSEEAPES